MWKIGRGGVLAANTEERADATQARHGGWSSVLRSEDLCERMGPGEGEEPASLRKQDDSKNLTRSLVQHKLKWLSLVGSKTTRCQWPNTELGSMRTKDK
ncbi:hypothetical protein SRHO_G00232450 [Serrasalmus rhombeus]